tara:strand:- start:123 stop:785 length:663 start_codon:yes stop_codon:yes gene_type:complete
MTTEQNQGAKMLDSNAPVTLTPEEREAQRQAAIKTDAETLARQMTSKYQKETAAARKQVSEMQKQQQDLSDRIAKAEEDARVARLAGDDDEEADRIRERMRLEKQLEERESRVGVLERKHTMQYLTQEYGISEALLEDYDTAAEMETAAKDHQLQTLREEVARLKEGPVSEPEEPKQPGFDVATGRGVPPSKDNYALALSNDPNDKAKFEEMVKEAKRVR